MNLPHFNSFFTLFALSLLLGLSGCSHSGQQDFQANTFVIQQDEAAGTLSVFRQGSKTPLLVQHARPDFRPYLHPLRAPDGKGVFTDFQPEHHRYETGLFWSFTDVNGRDFFTHPEGDHWQRVSMGIADSAGEQVSWQTVYHLLDENGEALMEESQLWSLRQTGDKLFLDVEWRGKALQAISIGQQQQGGLFVRMPWEKGIAAEVVNAARQRNERANGQRAYWLDVGMEIAGRDDWGHITLFDHPENKGFPQSWQVTPQLGAGPVPVYREAWSLAQGETGLLRHQLLVYAGQLDDVQLTENWKDFIGSESMYATAVLWGIAQEEGRNAKFLTPEEAVDNMTVADGFEVNVWAAEPMITQPMAFCWDDRGRMWVAENRDYESRGTGFSNSGDSRILILEDTDGDGRADSRKVFLEGIPFPAAIAVGFDGLFLGAPPNLLFVPDRDGDDRADEADIEVLLTGWGIRDRHETINSLHWGPDGWLYGCEGFATPSKIRKPKGKGRIYRAGEAFPEDLLEAEGVDIDGGVWRYHPTKKRFEVVAHGFSNPWGIDYDANGQLFITACVIPHLFHVIPGGIYHRQGGRHFNPYVYRDIQTIVDHRHRSAHGGARLYLSDAFPPEYQGQLFMANIHEHAVLADKLEPKGSGFVAHHGEDFLMANNAQWIGFSIEIGPEGGVYVLDWHDADICGKEVLQKETGRIFRIMPTASTAQQWEGRYADLNTLTDEELLQLQLRPSAWHARRARLILQKRAAKGELQDGTHAALLDIFYGHKQTAYRLRALWGLHLTQGLTEAELLKALKDKQAYVRAWAVQLLCEDQAPSEQALAAFTRMAAQDPSPVVRLYLAAALQRMPQAPRWEIARALLNHPADTADHNIPWMIWFGVEPLVAADTQRALELAAGSEMPVISEFIARRAIDAGRLQQVVTFLGGMPKARNSLLRGMLAGLEGHSDLQAPPNWAQVYARLKEDARSAGLALEVAQRFGDAEAAKTYLATLLDTRAPVQERQKALQALAAQQRRELPQHLPALLEEPAMRLAAIQAMAHFEEEKLGKALLTLYPQLDETERTAALQTLASRHTYGWMLTEALKLELIPKTDIPAYVARQLRRVVGNGFVEVWGPIDQLSSDKAAALARYRALLTEDALAKANVANGRLVFQRSCGACHKMYGEGGTLGPDLTGSNRANLDYLLSNILNPSEEIPQGYKMEVITTRDGRTYVGTIAAENERQLSLRMVGQEEAVPISKADIQAREETPMSMMPEGLLNTLSQQEVLDLVAYLRTTEQVQ